MARTADWRIDLMTAHPRLFKITTGEPERSFGYPLCEAGWRDVLVKLCTRIENALQGNETFQFVRIKQKFGVLRVDWHGEMPNESRVKILEAIDLAVARSACTCEVCGAVGRRYSNRGWLATACAEHAVGYPELVEPGFDNIRRLRRVAGESGIYYARYDRETDTITEVPLNALGLEK